MAVHAAQPLHGITVVAVEQAVAAPFATRHLADLGARVIKIERPDGGDFARAYDTTVKGLSAHFVWLNRSKESLTLDLKHPAADGILQKLLARADVFVQNLAPGAADRLGTGPAALRSRYPSLIACNVSGYGIGGPSASKKAYDLLVQSEVGLVSITGTEESPCRVGISIADIAAGMYAYSAVLTALFRRTSTGAGATIEVSLFDALGEWMGFPMYRTAYSGVPLLRSGPSHVSIAPYGPFSSAGGAQVYLAVQNAREWTRFCVDVLQQAELVDDGRYKTNELRLRHRDELRALIEKVFGRLSLREIVRRLDAAGIGYSRMNSVAEFVSHPQLESRDRWCEIDSEVGPLRALYPPIIMDGVAPAMGAVPSLGQHSGAILSELGFDEAAVERLRKQRAI